MTQVRSVPPVHTAKVFGIISFLLASAFSCVGLIGVMIWSTESPVVTLATLIALPVVAGVVGFLATAAGCSIYNQLAEWMGGISVDFADDVVASREQAAEARGAPKGRSQVRSISIWRMKPNPAGKVRRRDGSPPEGHMCGEWVDIRNHGMGTVTTKGICLYHLAYVAPGGAPECRLVASLPERWLKPGETLRMHSGQRRELALLPAEDSGGADWHGFTGEDVFNYNEREGDTLVLYEVGTESAIDSVSYEPDPPQDVILLRQDSRLLPAQAAASRI